MSFSFREYVEHKGLNEMAPVRMKGHAPFESLDKESKSKDAIQSDFIDIGSIKQYTVFIHKKSELIKVCKLYFDDVTKDERWAVIADLSFRSELLKSSNKLINNKKAIRINTVNVREVNRRDNIATELYMMMLSKDFVVISDGFQYEGAVKLWKSFTNLDGINLYIWDEKNDKIISKMTSKTHDNSVWSNGDLGDYSKMGTKLILSL